jgi:predicted SAM-dependent methyltransferase
VKLHLGCGENVLPGWVNVDIGADDPRVTPGDVRNLDSIAEDGSVSQIYACHVLEHVPRAEEISVLSHWCRKLSPGGACFIAVPDFNYLVAEYQRALDSGESWWTKAIIEPLMGGFADGHEDEHNHHHSPLDYGFLEHLMTEAGFVRIRRYQPAELGCYSEDWSLWPLSLNVVGFRPESGDDTLSRERGSQGVLREAPNTGQPEVDLVLEQQAVRLRRGVERLLGASLARPVMRAIHWVSGTTRPLRRLLARPAKANSAGEPRTGR